MTVIYIILIIAFISTGLIKPISKRLASKNQTVFIYSSDGTVLKTFSGANIKIKSHKKNDRLTIHANGKEYIYYGVRVEVKENSNNEN